MVHNRGSGDGLTVRVAVSPDELEALRPYWEAWSQHPEASPDLCAWLCRPGAGNRQPLVLCLSRGHQPVGMLLGRTEQTRLPVRVGYLTLGKIPVRQITFGAGSQMGEWDSAGAAEAVRVLLAALNQRAGDCLLLGHLPGDGALYQCARTLPPLTRRQMVHETTVRWRMSVPRTLEEFLERRSRKARSWLRRVLRGLEGRPEGLALEVFRSQDQVRDFCVRSETVARKTYQRALQVGFLNTPEQRQLLDFAASRGWWRAFILRLGQQPIAYWSGLVYKKMWFSNWTGYDPAWAKSNPGTVLLLKMIAEFGREGVDQVDFGHGEATYKERFGDVKQEEVIMRLYGRSPRAFLLNLAHSGEVTINSMTKAVLNRAGQLGRLKNWWRARLRRSMPPGDGEPG